MLILLSKIFDTFLCFFGTLPPEFSSSCVLHLLGADVLKLDRFMWKSRISVPNCFAKFSFFRCSLVFLLDFESPNPPSKLPSSRLVIFVKSNTMSVMYKKKKNLAAILPFSHNVCTLPELPK